MNRDIAEKHARASVTAFVRRSLVLLTYNDQGVRSAGHGSGTLIVGPSGRVAVLTAAHVLEQAGAERLALVTDAEFFGDVVEEVVLGPAHLDVAIIVVRARYQSVLVERCLAMDHVETRPDHRLTTDELLVVAGFSRQFIYDVRRGENVVEHRFVDGVRYTYDHRHDRNYISVGWRSAKIGGESFPHRVFNIDRDAMTPLKKPAGISGGPVYRVTATRPGELWAPHRDLRLVGVATDWAAQRALALPYWRWEPWLRTILQA